MSILHRVFRRDKTSLFARGFAYAESQFNADPTQETVDRLYIEQDNQVDRNAFDKGISSFLNSCPIKTKFEPTRGNNNE